MRASRSLVTSVILVAAALSALPATSASASRCSAIGTVRLEGMALGHARPHFFYTEEGTDQSFSVTVVGDTCVGENGTVRYKTEPGSAQPGADYQHTEGQFSFSVTSRHQTFSSNPVTIPMIEDTAAEGAAETLDLTVTAGGTPQPRVETPRVPVFIVDDDGAARARFAFSEMTWSEFGGTLRIPVLRAGASSGSWNYSISGDGSDFSNPSSGAVSFNGRLATINFQVVNDEVEEEDERFTVTLSGAPTESPSTFTVTIPANDVGQGDTRPPRAWFHHPKHRERYRQGSFNADTINLFADDNSGHQEITASQLAIRKKMTNGNCKFWKGGRWRAGSCSSPKWFGAGPAYPAGGKWLYIYTAYPSLQPSVGTRIAKYTVYGRATDASSNRSRLVTGESRNTFEVTRR